MEPKNILFSFFIFQTLFPLNSNINSLEDLGGKLNGEKLFLVNCAVCHPSGKNLILPEKNLIKESLEANGMNSIDSIIYQVRNGKNGMPAFGDRLLKKDIKKIAEYILFQSEKNFEN